MPATLAPRRDPFAVPKPSPCVCAGTLPCCFECGGSGRNRAWFRLKPARSLAYRRVIFAPAKLGGGGWLKLSTARKEGGTLTEAEYSVEEFATPWRGRAFYVRKQGTDRKHETFLGDDGSSACSCEGSSYESAAKANQRAYACGEKVFPTAGCVHADCLRALESHGWLDTQEG